MDPVMLGAGGIGILLCCLIGFQIYQTHKATAAPKTGVETAIDDVSAKIKAILDQTGIPQSLANVKQFAEVGIALAGVDGLRPLIADVVPADRAPTVNAALDTLRTEVASSLLPVKPAA